MDEPKAIHNRRQLMYDSKYVSMNLCFNNGIPLELFQGEEWDISTWTSIVTDEAISVMVQSQSFKAPVVLNLSGAIDISDIALHYLTTVGNKLRYLSLQSASKISEKGINPLLSSTTGIQHLNLSGCTGISGFAFAIIGHSCKFLEELNISRCCQTTSWAFTKIFEGCNNLRSLDCSYCPQLMDNELMILSDRCKHLEKLKLSECNHISDIGVTYIAGGCKFLSAINISRSDFIVKISDISLLSLADNCHELISLDIAGCQNITDIGITWLSSGCKKLQSVNLHNCRKITNKGLRSIAEACSDIKSLVLTNVSQVSDVGIRHIAEGCNRLEHLDLSGLNFLSNSNKCSRKNGLHALAGSRASETLKSINLNKCIHVGHTALLAIARFKNIESLILSHCPNLSIDGMTAIARDCHLLQQLSFRSCGICITDDVMKTLRPLFSKLTYLDLTGSSIGLQALIELSQCHKLSYLNLSGCIGVDDNGIFALCEGNFCPGLRNLHLDRCCHVTNLSLTWITESLKDRKELNEVTLETLSFKDTGITASFAEGLAGRFRYSMFKQGNNAFGFFALGRCNDMRVIFDYDRRILSIVRIQALARAWKHRKLAEKVKQRFNMARVSTLLAALRRRQIAKKRADRLRLERWLRWKTAMKIQCWFRRKIAVRMAEALKRKRWLLVAPYAAIKIQAFIRSAHGRQIALIRSKQLAEEYQAALQACINIQRVFRTYRRMQQVITELKMNRIHLGKKKQAALMMQKVWRVFIANRYAQRLRQEKQLRKENMLKASRLIARYIRSADFRSKIHARCMYKESMNRGALAIQRWFMAMKQEEQKKMILQEKLNRLKFRHAVVIQMNWRGKLACDIARRVRNSFAMQMKIKSDKALRLSSWWRGCLARQRVTKLRLLRREELKQRVLLEIWASTKICALWRGHLGRLKADYARQSRAKRWIRCWNEDYSCFFYHDQITGKSQWHKPQEVLEYETRPICNNCSFYEAKVECSNCMEYFCFTCWDAVHFGGRRSCHKFRSLYDYYGKRISYELISYTSDHDDNFSSLWPSELEQDEGGLHLRVAPYREPSAHNGEWGIYEDEHTNRIFYHSDRTDEGHYDRKE